MRTIPPQASVAGRTTAWTVALTILLLAAPACRDRSAEGSGTAKPADADAAPEPKARGDAPDDAAEPPTVVPPDPDVAPHAERPPGARALARGDHAVYARLLEEAARAYDEAAEHRPDAVAPELGRLRVAHLEARNETVGRIRKELARRVSTLRDEGHSGRALRLRARILLAVGAFDRAYDRARMAMQRLDEAAGVQRVLGLAAAGAERWPRALEALERAVALDAERPGRLHARRGMVLDELGRLAEAAEAARRALRRTPLDAPERIRRLNLLAVVQKHRGEHEAASRTLRAATGHADDDPTVHHNRGALAEARGRLDRALAHYQRAVERATRPTTSWRLAHLRLKRDERNEAVRAFERAAKHLRRWSWPRSLRWRPAFDLGRLHARVEHAEKAVRWLERALEEARTPEATGRIRNWVAYIEAQASLTDR